MRVSQNISAKVLICAAGASRRMAPDDKLMLPIHGQPLLRHVAKRVLSFNIPTLVALPPKPHPRWGALEGLMLTMASHSDSEEGLAGTLRAAVATLPSSVTHLCVVLADLPDIHFQDFEEIFEQVKANPKAAIWRPLGPQGQPAHPTVFHHQTFSSFAKISGDNGAKTVIESFGDALHEYSSISCAGSSDIDTPQDYQTYLARS